MESKKPIERGQIWGLLMAGFGALMLLGNFHLVDGIGHLFSLLLFLGGAAAFAVVYLTNHEHWWALFPAGVLAAIGTLVVVSWFGRILFPLVLIAVGAALIYKRSSTQH